MTLEERHKAIELLEKYSFFLEDRGYMDTDWRYEEPFAIDEFLKTISSKNDDKMSLIEAASFLRAYTTSLKKELELKDQEIQELDAKFKKLQALKERCKGDLKLFRKDAYITGLEEKVKNLEKDNEQLICKLSLSTVKHEN